jgi:hypothetical protein
MKKDARNWRFITYRQILSQHYAEHCPLYTQRDKDQETCVSNAPETVSNEQHKTGILNQHRTFTGTDAPKTFAARVKGTKSSKFLEFIEHSSYKSSVNKWRARVLNIS